MDLLIQLFSEKEAAENARDEAVLEYGVDNVDYFQTERLRVSDLRKDATQPSVYRRSGDPLFVVQSKIP
jgi:hypothetical protein